MIPEDVRRRLLANPDVTSVGWGFKYVNGQKTTEKCIVVGVRKKKTTGIAPRLIIPQTIEGLPTDVQERVIVAYSHTLRRRPCPPGYSVGHVAITAGTLGAWVKRKGSDDWWMLSNNHVLAASNAGVVGDTIIQPGKADGGFSTNDRIAYLKEFVTINWDGSNGGGGCNPFVKGWMKLKGIRAVEQPKPNLVDAAIALPVTKGYVDTVWPDGVGAVAGMTELELGDVVKKVGRTTEFTQGVVEGVQTTVRVSYGTEGVATFQDQVEVKTAGAEFSQPGDSGSTILSADNKLGALLFAGGSGVTIGSPIAHVARLLELNL